MIAADLPPDLEPLALDVIAPTNETVAEFFAATASLRQSEIDFLLERGVPPLALVSDDGEDGWAVGRAFVVIGDDGLFDFAREGDEGAVKALAAVARDADGRPADIVAWCPKQDRAAAHLGRVALLGTPNVDAWRAGEPLAVHKSALGWLRSERRGVVVVDEKRAWRALENVEVIAEDFAHGQRLRKILTAPTPRIFVREAA